MIIVNKEIRVNQMKQIVVWIIIIYKFNEINWICVRVACLCDNYYLPLNISQGSTICHCLWIFQRSTVIHCAKVFFISNFDPKQQIECCSVHGYPTSVHAHAYLNLIPAKISYIIIRFCSLSEKKNSHLQSSSEVYHQFV